MIARASNQLLAAVVASIAIVLFAIFLIASAFSAHRRKADVPPALRPGPSDEELENKTLVRFLALGTVTTLFMAVFLPAYWLREPTRIKLKEKQFAKESVERGEIVYRDQLFSEHKPGAPFFAANCQRCHGKDGEGSVQSFKSAYKYAEPPLRYIVARYKAAGRNEDDIKLLIRDAIERGRAGTPMPTWGLSFGGPLNSQQVDDLINFIYSMQKDPTPLKDLKGTAAEGSLIFAANCAVCHTRPEQEIGPDGKPVFNKDGTAKFIPDHFLWGGIGPDLRLALNRVQVQDLFDTISEGRLNTNRASMPAWAHLGKSAVNALVEFIKSIQVAQVSGKDPYP